MKVVQINTTCGVGSTGKICEDISKLLVEENIENYILYSSITNGYELGIGCASQKEIRLQSLKSHMFGNYGFNSKKETKKIIKELERIKPDIVHLHNIHGHDCNLELLFQYFKEKKTKLIWTFHDCWAFTGYCTHFDMAKCDKWKNKCEKCPQCHEYSFLFDRSSEVYDKKKKLFKGLDLTIVTPSRWLADKVKDSFLKDYSIQVINNGIDLSVFKPTVSNFRAQYGISAEKKIILGVAFDWGERKGLDVFVELVKRLNAEKYQIVLVGTNNKIDKQLPKNIISIYRTQSQEELVQIYSASDIFLNPTREENYPTVNMEAIACGTPVITFDTGGSTEMLGEYGSAVEKEDIDGMIRKIEWYESQPRKISKVSEFDKNNKYEIYVELYRRFTRE